MAMTQEEKGVMRTLVTLLEGELQVLRDSYKDPTTGKLASSAPYNVIADVRKMERVLRNARRLLPAPRGAGRA